MNKRIASHLAKALDSMSRARFNASGHPEAKAIDQATDAVSALFKASGYQYSSADGVRIKLRQPERPELRIKVVKSRPADPGQQSIDALIGKVFKAGKRVRGGGVWINSREFGGNILLNKGEWVKVSPNA